MSNLIGGIEAGGTKFVCAVGTGPDDLRDEARFPTTTPEETLSKAIAYFEEAQAKHGTLSAIGIGAFGPLDPNPQSPTFGHITTTPKPHWGNADVVGTMKKVFNVPIGFDTDVNAAALSEHHWGAAQNVDNLIYLTIGTGVGGGVMVNGQLVHGLIHPELGHISLPHDWERDPYKGRCPYHGDCLEGMAAGPAIGERWQTPAYELPSDHPAWDLEAHYLALALRTFICTLSPQRIILGGGVMEQPQLFPLLRKKTKEYLNGYVQSPALLDEINNYIVPPGLGNKAGVLGAFALGMAVIK